MGNVTSPLIPKTQRLLTELGNRLKLARLRRGLQAKQVAERAGMAPLTLRSIERGSSTVTLGAYVAVMQVLGLADDLNLLAKEDETGRHLQDAKLTQTKPRKGSAGVQVVPKIPSPKKPASAKKSVTTKKPARTPPERETAASKLAAQIFTDGDK